MMRWIFSRADISQEHQESEICNVRRSAQTSEVFMLLTSFQYNSCSVSGHFVLANDPPTILENRRDVQV